MSRSTARYMILAALAAVLLFMGSATFAQSRGFTLRWGVITMGGDFSGSGANGFTLNGTAGQVATDSLSGGGFTLDGGVWHGSPTVIQRRYFLPVVKANSSTPEGER